jgi:hypothetical protein
MKLISPVPRIDVKRAFIASQYTRYQSHRRYLPLLTKQEFSKKLARAKARAKKLNNAQLDRIIGKEWKPRRDAYNSVDWYIGTVKTNEVAAWKGAGGLPIFWTKGPLIATAEKVSEALRKNSKLLKSRIKRSVSRILQTSADTIQKDRYLFPIILPAGTIPDARRGMKKFKGDIDDGCMRSIALAISGKKTIKAYIGVRKRSKH